MTGETAPAGLRFGALINPNSLKNRRRPPDLSSLRAGGAPVEAPPGVEEIPAALARLAAAEVEVLCVSGGDGAVLAAMTGILCDDAFRKPPILCLIPSGTTNMTAADVGFRTRGDPFAAAAARAAAGGGRLESRSVLQLDGVADAAGEVRPRAGMFFGAAGICRVIRFCRRNVHTRGFVGGAASWLTLAPVLVRSLLSPDADGLLAGDPADIRIEREGVQDEALNGEWSVMMASTLRRLALGARPFWGRGSADNLAATFVRAPTRRLACNALPLLYGVAGRPSSPAYESRRADAVTIAYSGEVTLDGELYAAAAARPLRLSRAGALRFMVA